MSADASALAGLSSMATRHLLAELAADYARLRGVRVAIASAGGVDVAKRVAAGERCDFVVLAGDAIDRLAAAGHVIAGSRTPIARSGIAIAVRAGAARPDIATEAALREAVARAASIGYSTGPSGTHLVDLVARWGLAGTIAGRMVQAPPGVPVAALVARGDVELGFQQASEFAGVAGIDVVGMLPPGVQFETVFTGAVCAAATRPGAAADLLRFLASADAAAAKVRHAMQPASA